MVSVHEEPEVSCDSEIPDHFCVECAVVVSYYYGPQQDCGYEPDPEIKFDNGRAVSSRDLEVYVFYIEF